MSRPRLFDSGYLSFLRQLPCCICGRTGETEACHIRIGFLAMGKKPNDSAALPMCHIHHSDQHSMNETEFWRQHGEDPFEIAARLYAEYGGSGGQPKKPKPAKLRKPKHLRQKIKSRGFTKSKRKVG